MLAVSNLHTLSYRAITAGWKGSAASWIKVQLKKLRMKMSICIKMLPKNALMVYIVQTKNIGKGIN